MAGAMWRFHLDNIVRRAETDAVSVHSSTSRGSDRKKNSRLASIQAILSRRRSNKNVTYTKKCPASELNSSSSESQLSQLGQSPPAGETRVQIQLSKPKKRPSSYWECPLCLSEQPMENFPEIQTCEHRSCKKCLRQYLEIEITESRVNIACPECSERYHPTDIAAILDDRVLMAKYEEFALRRLLVTEADTRWCPAPDCGFAVIASGCASCPKLKCLRPGCDTYFCYHCKQSWHPNQTCDAARAERHKLHSYRSSSISFHEPIHNEIKTCPRCGAFIIKIDDGSCNHMTCAVCGSEFCWLCMKEISDLHYLSPSGCTFWGKKPWSRKKKILWQLGTIIGAPVGIALIATIAVPAIVIGIPVWVGRKIYYRLENAQRHRRNIVIVSGVCASVIISPLLAALAVGIGVPILLAYVYGVVPISLCRSGGCGLTTTNSGGVRFEFEEDNDVSAPPNGGYQGDGHRVANPSIGPSIGEVSLPMTNSLSASGSHLDRVGILRDDSDRESASNRAIAGVSLNGSLCGSLAGPSGFQHRLEVHADVLATSSQTNKRASLSSESANFSLSDRSGIMGFGDDSSAKALCGSICGNREKDSVSAIIGPIDTTLVEIRSTAAGSDQPYQKMVSNCGSPVSGRSVTFFNDDKYHAKTKRSKIRSRSFNDKMHEQTKETQLAERLSIHSLMTDESGGELSPRDENYRDNKADNLERSEFVRSIRVHPEPREGAQAAETSSDDNNHRRKSCELALMEGRLPIDSGDRKANKKDTKKKKRLAFF